MRRGRAATAGGGRFVAPAVMFVETIAGEGGFAGFSYLWTRAEHILAASLHHMARR
jgi:hypothetical protein